MNTVLCKVAELAKSLADEYGLEIVEVLLSGSTKKPLLRVFIDKDEGVTLDDCERFSRAFSAVLDVEDPVQTSYVLEVSSPGLDRPLKDVNDFQKHVEKRVKIITKQRVHKQNSFTGTVEGVQGNDIVLRMDNNSKINISFDNILKATRAIEIK
jgi:ribosome maturation factor RimP